MNLFELYIGFRYLKSKKSQGFISFNTLLSIVIVFIGVFILIVVVSVISGFQSQIKDKILDVNSHITVVNIYGYEDMEGIKDYIPLQNKILSVKGVKLASPYLQGQGLVKVNKHINPVMIRGIGSKHSLPEDFKKFITEGNKKFKTLNEIYIGSEMAFNYNIKIGDEIEILIPKGRLTATMGLTPGKGKFNVLGFFKTGYYDFDTSLILMSLPAAQHLYDVGNIVWGIGVKIDDVFDMDYIASKIQSSIGFEYQTLTAEQRNQNLFYALKLERLIITIILFLVIIAAGFTIMGTLVMVVMEKKKSIGILKSMGAKPTSIMIIFVMEGFLIGVTGSFLGVIFGLASTVNLESIIRWIEVAINNLMTVIYNLFQLGIYYNIKLVPKNVYYIDSIPTEIKAEFVVFIAIIAVFLSTISAIFPSWYASKLQPVETIRYE